MILIAKIISALSNPTILSVPMAFALVFRATWDFNYSILWAIISSIFAFGAGVYVFIGVKIGLFSNFDISKREERPPIFVFAGLISLLYFAIVYLLSGPIILLLSSGGLLLGIVLESIINRKIKASVHMAVYSAFCMILGVLYGGYFWLFLILAPVGAWSRIKLRRHVLAETVIGSILGIALVMVVYLVIQYLYS